MKPKVLLIEDDPNDVEIFGRILEEEGYEVTSADNVDQGLTLVRNEGNDEGKEFDVVLTDLDLKGPTGREGRELVVELRRSKPHLPVILMTGLPLRSGDPTADIAIDVIQLGAFDYISKALDPREDKTFRADLAEMVDHAVASKQLMAGLQPRPDAATEDKPAADKIVGNSRVMQNVYKEIGRVAATPVTVLVRGETGTGKELVARAIYSHGDRAAQPFIVVNCTAIPENLLESELFGHEQGAFTGANLRRIGRFEQAHCGTIFLDEIGDMDLKLQQKLLRVLQEQTIERVGGKEPIRVDVRIIAATHRNLELAVEENEFRQDLYFRLNVAVISLPPLRERKEDIRDLVEYFIECYGSELALRKQADGTFISMIQHGPKAAIEREAVMCLEAQSWPGNVRELRSVVRKALVLANGYTITTDTVRKALDQARPPSPALQQPFATLVGSVLASAKNGERENVIADLIEVVERELYGEALRRAKGDQSRAARWLGVSRPTMRERLLRYGLHSVRERSTD